MKLDSNFCLKLLDNVFDGVYFAGKDKRITYWNEGAEKITGYSAAEVMGKRCSDGVLKHVDGYGTVLCEGACLLEKAISDGCPHEAEVYLHHKDGHRVPVLTRVVPIHGRNGDTIGAIEIFTDKSPSAAIRQRIQTLERLALIDPLTELGNRRHGEINLRTRLTEMRRYGWPFAVLFIDIDDFKDVNDRYGHAVGDRVLRMVARTLFHNVRPFDFVIRWGGEEFLVILTNIEENDARVVAEKLRSLVARSGLRVAGDIIRVTVSIGVTLARPGDTLETLLKRADASLYESKCAGKNRVSSATGS